MESSHPLPLSNPVPEQLQTNPELELAADLIRYTNKCLFLTGKAGSGKTTFLKRIRNEGMKRLAIVAPTGVAAINAGGMTIHSLFQLPFGLHLPEIQRNQKDAARRFSRAKLRLLRSLELLVIDEVSMVRADLLDAIDEVLRRYRDPSRPFGGVQLLMIGDLHQLPPVAKPDEWQILSRHYQTPYFFSSRALQQTDYQSVELKHIFRQSDPQFIELLNKVRDNQLDISVLKQLHTRYLPGFQPSDDQPCITLTTTNAASNDINTSNLDRLPGASAFFEARVTGEFPPSFYPTELKTEFKPGAQVMFIRNDQGADRRYYNGRIGRISRIDGRVIYVECPGEATEIPVAPAIWENLKYSLNESTQKIEEKIVGTFEQIPLKLAWAITIHKSQGLTFERAIIDAQASFASGQVYVALSRCKTFEGIVLRSPITEASVKVDPVVQRFTSQVNQRMPTETFLLQARKEFEQQLLVDLFDFSSINGDFRKLQALFTENLRSLTEEAVQQMNALWNQANRELVGVTQNFASQLNGYLSMTVHPSDNDELQTRLQKAAVYFEDKIPATLTSLRQLPTKTDNQAVNGKIETAMKSLQLNLFTKLKCFKASSDRFSSIGLQQAKVNAELEFTSSEPNKTGTATGLRVPHGVPHPELFRRLLVWRQGKADERDVPSFEILPNSTLRELVDALPVDISAFRRVRGIGTARSEAFGRELSELVAAYCKESGLMGTLSGGDGATSGRPRAATMPRLTLSATQHVTLEMHRAGKTIDEIAVERKLGKGTIEGHLADAIALGLAAIDSLMNRDSIDDILGFVQAYPETPLNEIKTHFGEKYSYGELKLAISSLLSDKSL